MSFGTQQMISTSKKRDTFALSTVYFNGYVTSMCPSPTAGWALREWWSLWELTKSHVLKCGIHEAIWPSSGLGKTPRFKG